jgi:hypothetical protein
VPAIASSPLRTLSDLGLSATDQVMPIAGEREAHRLLQAFIHVKASRYLKSLSVATEAGQYTSRLGRANASYIFVDTK